MNTGLAVELDTRDLTLSDVATGDQGRRGARLTTTSLPVEQIGVSCCVSVVVVTCFELLDFYQHRARHGPLSILFNYFTARQRTGRRTSDPAVRLPFQDGFETARRLGLAPLGLHPAPLTPEAASQKPSPEAYAAAEDYLSWHRKRDMRLAYRRLTTSSLVDSIRRCLEARQPVALGLWLTRAYLNLDHPSPVLAPSDERASLLHAVTVVGYQNGKPDAGGNPAGALLIRDSRGTTFGRDGYWWLPYQLCESLAYQAWTLRYEEDD